MIPVRPIQLSNKPIELLTEGMGIRQWVRFTRHYVRPLRNRLRDVTHIQLYRRLHAVWDGVDPQ